MTERGGDGFDELDSGVTELLRLAAAGDSQAESRLFDLLYEQLHGRAEMLMRHARKGDTLQPTALVHEAYLKVLCGATDGFESRAHFMGVLVTAMKHVLVDRARARRCAKRGGGRERELLATGVLAVGGALDAVDLQDAITRLAEFDGQAARIVELRFYAGLTTAEVADLLGTSGRTVERDWKAARAWLRSQLS